ncbi:putative reverse transcriptase domain-containing protein [Tanacetum coccineum]
MEECHKLLTDQVDDPILRYNVSKPLTWWWDSFLGHVTIQSDFFFNKDLEYLWYDRKLGMPALSFSKMKDAYYPDVGLEQMVPDQMWIEEECKYDVVAMYGDRKAVRTHMRILSVVRIEVFPMYRYNYMKKIVLRRADLKEYVIAERDFKYLYPSDFEDLYLLNLQDREGDFRLLKRHEMRGSISYSGAGKEILASNSESNASALDDEHLSWNPVKEVLIMKYLISGLHKDGDADASFHFRNSDKYYHDPEECEYAGPKVTTSHEGQFPQQVLMAFFVSTLGDGMNTSVLFDNRCLHSPLSLRITPRDVSNAGFNLACRVADFVVNSVWNWPQTWTLKVHDIAFIPAPNLDPNKRDLIHWRSKNGRLSMFSVSKAWEDLRPRGFEVRWTRVVWYSHCIPSHAFHLWLTLRGSLKTQDKLRQGDVGTADLTTLRCPLCNMVPDSHSHLFFECSFSSHVWCLVRSLAELDDIPPLLHLVVIHLILISSQRTTRSIIGRLVVAATTYLIWLDRNNRLFKNSRRSLEDIRDMIMVTIASLVGPPGDPWDQRVRSQLIGKDLASGLLVYELPLSIKKLANDKEVVEPCKKCEVITKEDVDSLKCNVSRLKDEALNFSKFKNSSIVLDDMLSRQKLSQDKEGLGFSKNEKTTLLARAKSSPSVEDNRINEPVVQDLNGSSSLQVNVSDEGYPKSIKEARGHPIEQVIGELNEKTLRAFLKLCIVEDSIWDKISHKLKEPLRHTHVDDYVCCQVQYTTEENVHAFRKEMREIHASINNDLNVLTAVVEDIAKVFLQDQNEE